MSFKYIQDYYGVPAKRGQRVEWRGKSGVITSSTNQYINIRFDGDKETTGPFHPTDEMKYNKEEKND
jgi:hypothetical protein